MDGRAYGDELAWKWSPEALQDAMDGPGGSVGCPREGAGSERLTDAALWAMLDATAHEDDWDFWAARHGDGA